MLTRGLQFTGVRQSCEPWEWAEHGYIRVDVFHMWVGSLVLKIKVSVFL